MGGWCLFKKILLMYVLTCGEKWQLKSPQNTHTLIFDYVKPTSVRIIIVGREIR